MQKNKKVLIIGGLGYIGSQLYHHLKDTKKYMLSIDDKGTWGRDYDVVFQFADITSKNYISDNTEEADVIILLAGLSSVQLCKGNFHNAFEHNVMAFSNIANLLKPEQTLIYASSSSVYGAHDSYYAYESDKLKAPLNPYDHTKQLIDQIYLQEYSHKNIIGLRFGTVNGFSKNFRTDVMLNAMSYSAIEDKCVNVFNGDTRRSILGITDCCRAIQSIIDNPMPGIYNLASLDSTSRQLGKQTAEYFGVEYRETTPPESGNEKLITKNYDFWVNTDKFTSTYNFTFKDTVDSILKDIQSGIAENKLAGNFINYSARTWDLV